MRAVLLVLLSNFNSVTKRVNAEEPVAINAGPWCDKENPTPASKCVMASMDSQLNNGTFEYKRWSKAQKPYWVEDFEYITNWTPFDGKSSSQPKCLNTCQGMRDWFESEHVPFNKAFAKHSWTQMMFIGTDVDPVTKEAHGSTTTYSNLEWVPDEPLCGIKFPKADRGIVRIWDFYTLVEVEKPSMEASDTKEIRIRTNWMLLDLPLLMSQAGHEVLPVVKNRPNGDTVLLPRSNDGVPSPTYYAPKISEKMEKQNQQLVQVALKQMFETQDDVHVAMTPLSKFFTEDLQFSGCYGIGVTTSLIQFETHVLKPLREAFVELQIETDVVACEQMYCAIHGHLRAKKSGTTAWLDEPTTIPGHLDSTVRLRFGFHFRIGKSDALIHDMWALFDLPKYYIDHGVNLWDRMGNETRNSYLNSVV